ncbi:NUDIX hydrolase [Christiangramia forsetii]|uniref:NUDIX family hydrolase n=2 Tax=Christiangramia forsetii TaxID=411153 RepID=A0LZ69_CHRFK|nr:NUDIX domain-containing protein [Christiangramia forsetii]GGG37577.1 DNA mismatch repair protein MutT [Christiangramia forsetii]CAL65664.1 NUDIX family hydrolase [Christiangramia forsetii KT0803]
MINNYSSEDKALLAVDCIIFGFDKEELKILLIKRDFAPEKGKWSLMGGFLKKHENLDQAADRILKTLTGINNVFLEQLHSYSKVDRDPAERTISVAYYALINIEDHNEELTEQFSAQWFSISEAPNLIFDHDIMVKHAISRLRYKTSKEPLGFELLPPKFTMKQLQKLYESILNEKLDKRNFINKINVMDILIKLDEKDMNSSRKGSFLYMFDENKYKTKKAEGFSFRL